MHTEQRSVFWWLAGFSVLAFVACFVTATGCATWNPYNRARWSEEEKRFGPTFPTRRDELREMAANASRLSEAEQTAKAEELTTRLRAESNALMRAEIVNVLGALPVSASMQGLRYAMNDPQTHVRIAACTALGQHGGAEAASLLSETLGADTDIDVRLAATKSLGALKGSTAIAGLSLALDDPDPALQYRAMQSLKNVSGEDFGNDASKWREFASRHVPGESTAVAEGATTRPY